MNTLKYFILRSIQTWKEHGFSYFARVVFAKIFGKNLEFINFLFRNGNYLFRWSDIGFAMIRNTYEYMQQPDFQDKYKALIDWLDTESKNTVDLFIKHIKLFYHNNIVHEDEVFTDREKLLQKKSFEFMGRTGILHPTGYGIFEDPKILKQIGDGSVFDVGASDGVESMMFAKLLPLLPKRKIYSFEPSLYNFGRLQKNIENSPYHTQIIPESIALGEKDGEMKIYGSGGAEVSFIKLSDYTIPSETVRVMRIDSFTLQEKIERVGLIKWDIEWAEIESILWGKETISRDKPVLIVSIYHNGKEFFETKTLIESWNLGYRFRVYSSEPGGTWVGIVLICY